MHNSERRADWEYDKHPTHSHNVQNQSISANSSAATATLPLKIQRRRAAVTTWLKGRRAQLREGHASYLQELLRVGLSEVAPEHPHGSAPVTLAPMATSRRRRRGLLPSALLASSLLRHAGGLPRRCGPKSIKALLTRNILGRTGCIGGKERS
jgi:hypothetical protein